METLYKWRVQEKDKHGRMRWRLVKSPMTEETARFWAVNNNKIIRCVDTPAATQRTTAPVAGASASGGGKTGPAFRQV